MHLKQLTLEHFRSYGSLTLTFDAADRVTVLTGENATGKTNILEAINVLALLHSPRTNNEEDLIAWEREYYRVQAVTEDEEGTESTMEVVMQAEPRKQRACFINGIRTPAGRYIGALPLIGFTPDDLTLWSGPPAHRRRVLDILLSQTSHQALLSLNEYKKVLTQRNALLRQIAEGTQSQGTLGVWNERLATVGALITADRLSAFRELQEHLLRELRILGERADTAEIKLLRNGSAEKEMDIREELLRALHEHEERDIARGGTTVGPHRDDWSFSINGRDIATFASRGQQRAALLAFLLLQASYIKSHTGKKPLLLFDDVFSELDVPHRQALLQRLQENQVIISTVEMDTEMRKDAKVLTCPLR